ncbi:hypothetical protein BC831DRAFT_262190 [Entophlyctis helioformis]|nr:hypothetical protein BC831DRAFT_262190 [Entophlyctis helioformis]
MSGICRAACGLCASESPEGTSSGHSTRSIRPTPPVAVTADCECSTIDGCCLACLDDALASLAMLLRDIDGRCLRQVHHTANAAARGLAQDSGPSSPPPPRPVDSSKWAVVRYVAPHKLVLCAISALFSACDTISPSITPSASCQSDYLYSTTIHNAED